MCIYIYILSQEASIILFSITSDASKAPEAHANFEDFPMAPPSGDYHLPSLSAVRPLPPLEALKSGWIFKKKPNFLGRKKRSFS